MQRFKSGGQAQRFLSEHAIIYCHFRLRRRRPAIDVPVPRFITELPDAHYLDVLGDEVVPELRVCRRLDALDLHKLLMQKTS